MTKPTNVATTKQIIRCAIYTRKSTEEGLQQSFNSLDGQREAAEAYIRSQQHEGWVVIITRYDDGGYTGGNTDRPALKRLQADIAAGLIDAVLVHRVDRLSRSLLDFTKLLELFDHYGVGFISVTQQFSTTSSMGRLTLHILLSFAQFEREMISERTRDKMAATRRKGKFCGGLPVLGYDVDPRGPRLVVNAAEAAFVRELYELYLKHESLLPVVDEVQQRGLVNKQWTTKSGKQRGGAAITKTSLHVILTNVVYVGLVKYKDETHAGEHPAIVERATFDRVQALLKRNGRNGGATVRNSFAALLKGILFCTPCGCAMTPTHATKGNKRYRYYLCTHAQSSGRKTCPSKSIPAGEIERFVVERIRAIGRDPELVRAVIERANEQLAAGIVDQEAERKRLERELARDHTELRRLLTYLPSADEQSEAVALLADLQTRIHAAERRLTELRDAIAAAENRTIDVAAATQSLAAFDPVWEALTPREKVRVVRLLVERVEYDGSAGQISITFHPHGIGALTQELAGASVGSTT